MADGWVVLGQISGLFGVRGWVKVFSHTQPREGIVGYDPLYLERRGRWEPVVLEDGDTRGKGILIKLRGCDDRDSAAALIGCRLGVPRAQLPPLAPDEYYWADLQGLRVRTLDGVDLGVVDRLFETGANDVVVVRGERERLLPFLQGQVIKRIDLEQGLMQVDWDPEF